MDEARITLTIKPIYIERIIYWVLILVLAILLFFAWTSDEKTVETAETATVEVEQANSLVTVAEDLVTDVQGEISADVVETLENELASLKTLIEDEATAEDLAAQMDVLQDAIDAAVAAQADVPAPSNEDSCDDGVKNQDETDVDCGGSCGKCAAGESCDTALDCSAAYCTSGKCTNEAEPELTGKLQLEITQVWTEPVGSTAKVTKIAYTITNGLGEDFSNFRAELILRDKRNVHCLNQLGEASDCDDPYAEFATNGVKAGKSISEAESLDGTFSVRESGDYSVGDDFVVSMYLYDSLGDKINDKTISATKLVKL
ncbi:MAG: hypothetical protein OXR66_05700 [Candidatus Woesearchaeota archaeon]|nr:hypothetical protein [Candidatus Woesearchaeota archaeon]